MSATGCKKHQHAVCNRLHDNADNTNSMPQPADMQEAGRRLVGDRIQCIHMLVCKAFRLGLCQEWGAGL